MRKPKLTLGAPSLVIVAIVAVLAVLPTTTGSNSTGRPVVTAGVPMQATTLSEEYVSLVGETPVGGSPAVTLQARIEDALAPGEIQVLGDRLPPGLASCKTVIVPKYPADTDPLSIMPAPFLDPIEVGWYRDLCIKGVSFALENREDGYRHIVDVKE